jgi:lipooligosaccharide transport system permease protein
VREPGGPVSKDRPSGFGRPAGGAVSKRIGRLEKPALMGVLVREIINFSSFWRSSTFSATVEPTVYLLAFGFGIGSLVNSINGLDYVDYVGTGTVATAVLFSSAFPGMFGTYGCAPMLVAICFGLDPSFGMLLVPFIGVIAGFGWANFGIAVASRMTSIDNFSYVISAVLTPLFLVAGTFFPIEGLPDWAQVVAQINPLYHLVQLVRHAVFGFETSDPIHLAVLVAFGLLMWRLAVRWLAKRLID